MLSKCGKFKISNNEVRDGNAKINADNKSEIKFEKFIFLKIRKKMKRKKNMQRNSNKINPE